MRSPKVGALPSGLESLVRLPCPSSLPIEHLIHVEHANVTGLAD